jgi:small-conductance mechanosensitive channel
MGQEESMQETFDWASGLRKWALARLPDTVAGVAMALLTLALVVVVYRVSRRVLTNHMHHEQRTEAQVKQFETMWKYAFLFIGIVFVVVSMSASLAAMGLTVAFVSMILGWSLQRPVTGVAAWLMVMIKRPFVIGDRIIIQGMRGDVLEITPMYILLGEVGGTIGGEESSSRGILIPNAVLFDQMVINYAVSTESKYILAEINVRVSYESNYNLAMETLVESVRKVTPEIIAATGWEPVVRSEFFDSGVMMRARYQTIAADRERISSDIVGQIMAAFGASGELGFAYPHAAVDLRPVDSASLPPMLRKVPPKAALG